jgi:glycosyltransferase involved in cell wall biosynthesis
VPPPLVTIVIPSHGQARFLAEATESALDQSYPRVEVVIVDDAAPDGDMSAAIAREFGVRFVRTTATLGPGGARNAGIAAGKGEFVLPLDADDLLARDYVAKAAAVLGSDSGLGVCYGLPQFF